MLQFLEQVKNIILQRFKKNVNIEISSDDSHQEDSDEENFNAEISNKENKVYF